MADRAAACSRRIGRADEIKSVPLLSCFCCLGLFLMISCTGPTRGIWMQRLLDVVNRCCSHINGIGYAHAAHFLTLAFHLFTQTVVYEAGLTQINEASLFYDQCLVRT
jgi:hypothetical protein